MPRTKTVFELTEQWLWPHACVVCGQHTDQPWPLCIDCQKLLPFVSGLTCLCCGQPLISTVGTCLRCRQAEYFFDTARPLFLFNGMVKILVSAYKSHNRRSLADFFAEQLALALDDVPEPCIVVPVPPRPWKIYRKGWDQIQSISVILERRYGFRVWRGLRRIKGGDQQKKLGARQRRQNIAGRFLAIRQLPVGYLPVIIDDVFTTGATVSDCARALKAAGAPTVHALVIALD